MNFRTLQKTILISSIFLALNPSATIAASKYWVTYNGTGTGNWSDSHHWATSSNGTGGAAIPTSSDIVYFNASSFNGPNQVVTIDQDGLKCKDMVWTNAANTPTIACTGNYAFSIYGSLTLISQMNVNWSGNQINFVATSGSKNINTAGNLINTRFYFSGASATWTLQSALNIGVQTIELNAGTINSGSYAITCGTISCANSETSTLNLGSSALTINANSNTELDFTQTSTTIIANNCDIAVVNTYNKTFTANFTGQIFHNISFSTGEYNIALNGNSSFNNIAFGQNNWIELEANKTLTCRGNLTAVGDCGNWIVIKSNKVGAQANICQTGTQLISYSLLMDINENGAGSITCDNGINGNNNSNIVFTNQQASRNLYWIGGSGYWGTASHWTTNNDGTESGNGCIPTLIDNVYFNEYSFTTSSQRCSMNKTNIMCANMDWTNVTNVPEFYSNGKNLNIAGNLTFAESGNKMTVNHSGNTSFLGNSTNNFIKTNGNTFSSDGGVYFLSNNAYHLEDDLYCGNDIHIDNGILDVQNLAGTSVSNIYIGGSWFNGGGIFEERADANKWVVFNGSNLNSYIENPETFYNLKVEKSASDKELSTRADVNITNQLKINTGIFTSSFYYTNVGETIDLDNPNGTLKISTDGIFTTAKNLIISAGTVDLESGRLNIGASGNEFLEISGGNLNIAATNQDSLNIQNYLKMSSGTFTHNGGIVTLMNTTATDYERIYFTGGTYNFQSGTVEIKSAPGIGANKNLIHITNETTLGTISGNHKIKISATNNDYQLFVESGRKIGSLQISSTGKTGYINTNALDIRGSLTLSAGTLNMNSNNINLGGNFTKYNGAFATTTETVTFDGIAAQIINGWNPTLFYNLTLNNTNGLSITNNSTIENQLLLSNGKINLNGNTLFVGTTISNGSILGANANNYIIAFDNSTVIGKLDRYINTLSTYDYPIGDLNYYTPLSITFKTGTELATGASLTVYTKPSKIAGMNSSISSYINRYWDYTPDGISNPLYDITINYNDADIVVSEKTMKPIKLSGTTWYSPTNAIFPDFTTIGSCSQNEALNQLKWANVTSFSQISGASDGNELLPVELVQFETSCENNKPILSWITASESNNDYFSIEVSKDLIAFSEIAHVKGAGNSNHLNYYTYIDTQNELGNCYYRLKQVDIDGKYTCYKTITSSCTLKDKFTFITTINCENKNIYINSSIPNAQNFIIELIDSYGRIVKKGTLNLNKGENTSMITYSGIATGVYYLKISGNTISNMTKLHLNS